MKQGVLSRFTSERSARWPDAHAWKVGDTGWNIFFHSLAAMRSHNDLSGHLANEPAASESSSPFALPLATRCIRCVVVVTLAPIQFEASVKSSVSSSQSDRQWWFMRPRGTTTSHFRNGPRSVSRHPSLASCCPTEIGNWTSVSSSASFLRRGDFLFICLFPFVQYLRILFYYYDRWMLKLWLTMHFIFKVSLAEYAHKYSVERVMTSWVTPS